jgi:hypothetical protein
MCHTKNYEKRGRMIKSKCETEDETRYCNYSISEGSRGIRKG